MSTHIFTIKNRPVMGGLVVVCSCGGYKGPVFPHVGADAIPLAQLNEIAHEHIEAADREQGYRVESAIRSEDELVDIETGHRRQT